MSITRYCAELLEAASRYHVRYGDRLANHLPMVLIALDKMGASHEQLQRAFDRSVPHLERPQFLPPDPNIPIAKCRNREELFPTALRYYETQVKQHGIAECLRRELPPLLPAIATAAFHPLIRTAYGVDAQHQEEVAAGLAYWNLEYHTLASSEERTSAHASEILPRLAARFPLISLAPGNIADHMHSVTRQRGWLETPIQPEQLGLEDIARVAIDAYRGTQDFTMLHGVTGCHALRLILPYCPNSETAMRHFWAGLSIAYLSTGPKDIKPTDSTRQSVAWKDINRSACRSRDDHVIKLVYSCWQEQNQYLSSEYRFVASDTVSRGENNLY
ncbi:questin oxidase family protein [Microbulbifer magnicolonia]|uniref:questin oxidase family protein n=1 Tax=Microbulbifer magnicolonia TaxID=3109744 RepID=UPI002B410BB9|nr:questin oxidase family protein [Microbulbifer sp. GG15]